MCRYQSDRRVGMQVDTQWIFVGQSFNLFVLLAS
jgi:hypothetical protein